MKGKIVSKIRKLANTSSETYGELAKSDVSDELKEQHGIIDRDFKTQQGQQPDAVHAMEKVTCVSAFLSGTKTALETDAWNYRDIEQGSIQITTNNFGPASLSSDASEQASQAIATRPACQNTLHVHSSNDTKVPKNPTRDTPSKLIHSTLQYDPASFLDMKRVDSFSTRVNSQQKSDETPSKSSAKKTLSSCCLIKPSVKRCIEPSNLNAPRSTPIEKTYIIASKSFQEASKKLCEGKFMQHWSPSGRINLAGSVLRRSVDSLESIETSITKPLFQRSCFIRHEILNGKASFSDYYDLNVKNLGKGSFGSVFAARDLRTNSLRAVKIVYKPNVDNITRLKREILIMKSLDHPNIIRLFEVFEDEQNLYLVMEICLGGELFDRVIKSGHFSEHYAAIIVKQILSAVVYCHANDIMHRDLKPENVLYSDLSSSLLKVIDWGFAAKCSKNRKFSSLVGTPYYVAPEVLHGNYDRQCDLWSAGVILFILLSGYPPFHGKDNKAILQKVKEAHVSFDSRYWSNISEEAKNLISGLLCYNARERLTAAQALQHPWLRYHTKMYIHKNVPLTSKLGGYLIKKFRSFQKQKKLKKLALTAVAFQMEKRNLGNLYDVFSALDTNGDGVLSISEFSTGLSHMDVKFNKEIHEIFSELDTDGNLTIDYTEFLAASLDDRLYEHESVCKGAFLIFDLDGDGKITVNEIRNVVKMNFDQGNCLGRVLENIIQEVDVNHDGSIDFQEFMQMMRANQHKIRRKCLSNFVLFPKSRIRVP